MNAETFCEHFATFADAPNGVEKLRAMILELAVQGKLVTQDVEDEPAIETLARIESEREARVAAGEIPHQRPVSPITEAAELFALPAGWQWTRFGHLCLFIEAGWSPKCEERPRIGDEWGVIKISAVTWGRFNADENKSLPSHMEPRLSCEIRSGDFLMSRANTAELVARSVVVEEVPPRLLLNDKVLRVKFPEEVDKLYVNLFNNCTVARRYYVTVASGTSESMRNVSRENILEMPIPLPPLAEQRRIVEKVDQLLGLCDELAARQAAQREKRQRLVGATLDRLVSTRNPAEFPTHAHRLRNHFDQLFDTPTTIPQLRQTIVNLAAHGQLVRQISDDGPATEALKRNREHHKAHWEQIQLQQFKRQGKIPRSEAWKQAYEAPAPASDDGLPTIPSTWGWERIELLGIDPLSTVQTGPFGSQLLKTEFIESGVPVIAVGNLTGLGFTTDKLYFISEEKAKDLARYDVQAGDVLFARSGATLGKVCVAPDFIQDWRMTGHILRARLNQSLILPELFVLFLWGASFVTEQVSGGIRGMTRPGFNTGLLERIVLPIPPLAEQKRIVTKVTELLSLCDVLEAKLTQAESASTQLLSAAVHHLLQN